MAYSFIELKKQCAETHEWLKRELGTLHTGRATPAVLDMVQIETYGARQPIKHIASIVVEDARTLRVSPWDSGQIRGIEKAIMEANIGLSVATDDRGIRVIFPELTSERRAAAVKLIGQKLEEARVKTRAARDVAWHDIQEKEREGTMGEDEKFRCKEEMEKTVKESNETLEMTAERKEKEINA